MGSPTAAALVVGNEILSGKVHEANVLELARTLRSLGVVLARVVVIPDDLETIAREAKTLSVAYEFVFTSGGVGVTHDDLTIAGIARAFAVPVVRDPELEALLRRHYGNALHENHLALANVPQGARKLTIEGSPWPLTAIENVFILPGVPEIFHRKLSIVRAHLRSSARPFLSRAVFTRLDEAILKPLLDEIVARHSDVEVGSYPRWGDPTYDTKITFDGQDEAAVGRALEDFLKLLPPGEPQWIEEGRLSAAPFLSSASGASSEHSRPARDRISFPRPRPFGSSASSLWCSC
ncbi:MAG: competence/damage-inducible protein A [Vicinamibacteria bacterium]